MRQLTKTGGLLLALACIPTTALALPQAPHDDASGISCGDCHVPYGGLTGVVEGTVTSGSTSSMTDSSASWDTSQWVTGVVSFVSGANVGEFRPILSNSSNQLVWDQELDDPMSAGDTYRLGLSSQADVATQCKTCHNPSGMAASMPDVSMHTDGNTFEIGCGVCHDPHNTDPNSGQGAGLIRDELRFSAASQAVAWPSGGANDYVVGAPPYNGVCEVCHTSAGNHRNNATGDHGHFIGMDCVGCHQHTSNFQVGEGSDVCVSCHQPGNLVDAVDPMTTNGSGLSGKHTKHVTERNIGCVKCHSEYISAPTHIDDALDTTDPSVTLTLFDEVNTSGVWSGDSGPSTGTCASMNCHDTDMDWYGTTPWVLPDCTTSCHNAALATRRQVTGAGGDFTRSQFTHADSVVAADCLLCHNNDEHMAGTVRLANVDTPATIYDYEGNFATLGEFCLSCHDGAAGGDSTPFSDGVTVPGLEPEITISTHYTTAEISCFDCHMSGITQNAHGSESTNLSQISDTVDGQPVSFTANPGDAADLCMACHDADGPGSDDIDYMMSGTAEYVPFYADGDFYYKTFNSKHDMSGAFDCTSCHSPHYITETEKVIDPDDPATGYAFVGNEDAFCLRCHDNDAPGGIDMSVHLLSDVADTWYDEALHGGGTIRGDIGADPNLGYLLAVNDETNPYFGGRTVIWDNATDTLEVGDTTNWPASGGFQLKIMKTFKDYGACEAWGYWAYDLFDCTYTGVTGTGFTGVTGTRNSTVGGTPLPDDLDLVGLQDAVGCELWFSTVSDLSTPDLSGSAVPAIPCDVCHEIHGSNDAQGGNPYLFKTLVTADYSADDQGAEWNGTWHPNQFVQTNWPYRPPDPLALDPTVQIRPDYLNNWFGNFYYDGGNPAFAGLNVRSFQGNMFEQCSACHSTSGGVNAPHHDDPTIWPCGGCHVAPGAVQCNGDPVCLADWGTFDDNWGPVSNYRKANGTFDSYRCNSCHSHGKASVDRGGVVFPLF